MKKTLEKQQERWEIRTKFPEKYLAKSDFNNLEKQLLFNRGIKTVKEAQGFLDPDYNQNHDPFLMRDMRKAVSRVQKALTKQEKVVVYGDYDADGLTATALLYETLTKMGLEVQTYIPQRETEGYGLNCNAISMLQKSGISLIVTVDCGITAIEEVKFAKEKQLDIIITDHHSLRQEEGKDVLPQTICLNPKRQNDYYPFANLAGVGVAYKLAQALYLSFPEKLRAGQEKWLLDLVTIGTICDVVPLVGENRLFAYYGLKVLEKTKRPGLALLAEMMGLELARITSFNVGFQIGPRLNATGRLGTAEKSLELLIGQDKNKLRLTAIELNKRNEERQTLTERIVSEANESISSRDKKQKIYLLADPFWPSGVVGIAASKLAEKYLRPVIVFEDKGEVFQGSARSPHFFNIIEALNKCSGLLQKYGGHARAAGLAVAREDFAKLEAELNKICGAKIKESDLVPLRVAEIELEPAEISKKTSDFLKKLEPFGPGNPVPVFLMRNLEISKTREVGKDKKHLKLEFLKNNQWVKGVFFNYIGEFKEGDRAEALFQLTENIWNGTINYEAKCLFVRGENEG